MFSSFSATLQNAEHESFLSWQSKHSTNFLAEHLRQLDQFLTIRPSKLYGFGTGLLLQGYTITTGFCRRIALYTLT